MYRFRICRRTAFSAAHRLPWHKGHCARVHGHNYVVEVVVEREHGDIVMLTETSADHMVVDFADLDDVLQREVVERYDHQYINRLVTGPPTTENLAWHIARRVQDAVGPSGLVVRTVRVYENADSYAEVERHGHR